VDSAVHNVSDEWTLAHGQSGALPPVSLSSTYDLVWRALGRANTPALKKPVGLLAEKSMQMN